jgi:hypothetical protein
MDISIKLSLENNENSNTCFYNHIANKQTVMLGSVIKQSLNNSHTQTQSNQSYSCLKHNSSKFQSEMVKYQKFLSPLTQ